MLCKYFSWYFIFLMKNYMIFKIFIKKSIKKRIIHNNFFKNCESIFWWNMLIIFTYAINKISETLDRMDELMKATRISN